MITDARPRAELVETHYTRPEITQQITLMSDFGCNITFLSIHRSVDMFELFRVGPIPDHVISE